MHNRNQCVEELIHVNLANEKSNGSIKLDQPDSEFFHDKEPEWDYWQNIAIRFNDIRLDSNNNFDEIQIKLIMTIKNNRDKNKIGMKINIFAEKNSDISDFQDISYNISNRILTDASLTWYPDAGIKDQHLLTPNLAPIFREIVNLPGWEKGKDILLIFKPDQDQMNQIMIDLSNNSDYDDYGVRTFNTVHNMSNYNTPVLICSDYNQEDLKDLSDIEIDNYLNLNSNYAAVPNIEENGITVNSIRNLEQITTLPQNLNNISISNIKFKLTNYDDFNNYIFIDQKTDENGTQIYNIYPTLTNYANYDGSKNYSSDNIIHNMQYYLPIQEISYNENTDISSIIRFVDDISLSMELNNNRNFYNSLDINIDFINGLNLEYYH